MSYFAVQSGNIFRCVCADDSVSACVTAVRLHIEDDTEIEHPMPNRLFMTAEIGQTRGAYIIIAASAVKAAGNFSVEEVIELEPDEDDEDG